MKEYYEFLGLSETATDVEILERYQELKAKYKEDRWLDGEAGNEAAKKLTQVESAYHDIMLNRKNTTETNDNTYDFSMVEKELKADNIGRAQELLDEYNDRNAEWHYLQSVIFYKKNWMNDSKRQLEIAISLDPQNLKYLDAYAKLKQKIDFAQQRFNSGNYQGNPNAQNTQNHQERQMGNGNGECLNFCMTWCCMEMLCTVCCR